MGFALLTEAARIVRAAKLAKAGPFCSSPRKSHQGVSTTPGETQFTRIGLSSTARMGAKAAIAALMAPSPAVPGKAACAETAETKVMLPSFER